jgi:lipopolysaccharide export system permease protein
MRILTRYILREFLGPFLLSMLLFSVIILVITIFDQLKFIMDHKAGPLLAAKYFLLQMPFLLLQITPLAVLFAVLFSLGSLSKGSELIAMRSGGVDIFRVAAPLVLAGALVGLFSVLFNETVVPRAKSEAERVKDVEIEKKPAVRATQRWNVSLRGAGNRMYHIQHFDGPTAMMQGVLLLEFGQGIRLKSRLDAKRGLYEGGRWVFEDGWMRVFDDTGDEILAQPFARLPMDLGEVPGDFLAEQKEPRELNMPELMAYIEQLKKNGSDYRKEMVELHLKVAFPFACIVLVLLGVPTGWSLGKWSSVAASFGIVLAVAFSYIGLIRVGQALGESGVLPPILAGWMANALFTGLGGWLLVKKNR